MTDRRSFLMLAKEWEGGDPSGCFVSEKLDGMRAWWDGGVSRGLPATDVPWANTAKDARLLSPPIATGLWSRRAKAIAAPSWWLDELPRESLDLELWMGRGRFQDVISCCRSGEGTEWEQVVAMAIDCPTLMQVFEDGEVREPSAHWLYRFDQRALVDWAEARGADTGRNVGSRDAEATVRHLAELSGARSCAELERPWSWRPIEQVRLPKTGAETKLAELRALVASLGGEGLVIRSPGRTWYPKRMKGLWKDKPRHDMEGTVVGFTWGRATEKLGLTVGAEGQTGGRLLGKMGALVLNVGGKRLELSGFTDAEREMVQHCRDVGCPCFQEYIELQGKDGSDHWSPRLFDAGRVVTFTYRELTRDGLPKEAQYKRVRDDE